MRKRSQMKTPDFILTQDVTIGYGNDAFTLKANTFVRPIEERWLPKHVTDRRTWKDDTEVGCHTPKGIHYIKKMYLRQV